jgi:4-hydroxy-4-methyl-2-oxoglutarate aldolase
MLHAAIELISPGDVLVVATHVPAHCGMIGELIARAIQYRGAAGVILDACVRDLAVLQQLQLPIWCRGVSAAGTTKQAPGWVNVPVTCAGVQVVPGDLIVADDDGVVVVPYGEAAAVLEAGRIRQEKEAHFRSLIERGELSLDYNNLREVLKQKGVKYIE